MNIEHDKLAPKERRIRDAFLTEAMGECWHDLLRETSNSGTDTARCACGRIYAFGGKEFIDSIVEKNDRYRCKNIDFSTWDGFGKLWEWAQKEGWLEDFHNYDPAQLCYYLESPDRFADAVYEYLLQK